MTQLVRLGVLGTFVLGMPALAVLTAHTAPDQPRQVVGDSRATVGDSMVKIERPVAGSSTNRAPLAPTADRPFPTKAEQAAAKKLQQRLREAGATAFSLEFDFGTQSFIAHCQVPLPTSDSLSKAFQARELTPITAIESVLQQVQRWQLRIARAQGTRPH